MGIRAQEETRAAVAGRMADRWTNLPQCRPGSVETRAIDPLCGAIDVRDVERRDRRGGRDRRDARDERVGPRGAPFRGMPPQPPQFYGGRGPPRMPPPNGQWRGPPPGMMNGGPPPGHFMRGPPPGTSVWPTRRVSGRGPPNFQGEPGPNGWRTHGHMDGRDGRGGGRRSANRSPPRDRQRPSRGDARQAPIVDVNRSAPRERREPPPRGRHEPTPRGPYPPQRDRQRSPPRYRNQQPERDRRPSPRRERRRSPNRGGKGHHQGTGRGRHPDIEINNSERETPVSTKGATRRTAQRQIPTATTGQAEVTTQI